MPTDLIDRLAAHRTIGTAPRRELQWLVDHGVFRTFDAGQIVSHKELPVEGLFVVLSGHIAIFVDRGAGKEKVFEWRAGDVTGLLPYSRMVKPPGDSITQEPTEALEIRREDFGELIRECQEITGICVHIMIDRARVFTKNDLHDEKMKSLGKLSAGLAHELNNPASAIERSAELLEDRLEDAEKAARALGAARLSDAQLAAVDALRGACVAAPTAGVRSPIEQAEREDEIEDWLTDHNVDGSCAAALADTPVTIPALDQVARVVDAATLPAAIRWVADGFAVRGLASEIREAATRISGLVLAIKGFTHMDQATVAEPVDLVQSLSNTVAVLRSKARKKSATVAVNTDPDLPKVRGFAGELNQIWANLIDNALDAIPASGRVDVQACREDGRIAVRVVDNGSGIPDDVRERIFDPFFSTKPVGEGTGLGLDIVRRLVLHNNGDIAVESKPGKTEFKVVLAIADAPAGAQP